MMKPCFCRPSASTADSVVMGRSKEEKGAGLMSVNKRRKGKRIK